MVHRIILLILLSISLTSPPAWGQAAQVSLDGIISPSEYSSSEHHTVKGPGDILIQKDNNKLFTALSGTARIWSHVYFYTNDTIHVFHASAALGEIMYVRNGDSWSPLGKFNYTVRERVYDEALRIKQEAYLKDKGWVANNNNMGDGKTLEFCFDMSRWNGNEVRMAFVFMSDVNTPMFYPVGLKDATLMKELLYGGDPPDGLRFNVADWMKM